MQIKNHTSINYKNSLMAYSSINTRNHATFHGGQEDALSKALKDLIKSPTGTCTISLETPDLKTKFEVANLGRGKRLAVTNRGASGTRRFVVESCSDEKNDKTVSDLLSAFGTALAPFMIQSLQHNPQVKSIEDNKGSCTIDVQTTSI